MHRLLILGLLLSANIASAVDLASVTNTDATAALRTALSQGAGKAAIGGCSQVHDVGRR